MKYAIVLCTALALTGCQSALERVAERGNSYCAKKAATQVDDTAKAELNAGLRNAGALWTFDGITCD